MILKLKKISVPSEGFKEIENINLEKCTNLDAPCKYEIYNNILEKEKLYYWKNKDKLIYVVNNIEDDVQYNFAVTGANEQGEISNDKSSEGNAYVLRLDKNYYKSASIDDLAPGRVAELKSQILEGKAKIMWNKPLKNIDGTNNNDIAGFNVYYKKSTSDILPQLEIGYGTKQIAAKDAKCDIIGSLACEFDIENIIGLEKWQNYNFAVTAFDEKSNEYKYESDKVSIIIP